MKKITIIIIFLVGIILGVFIKSEYDSGKSKKVVVKQDYIFKGNVKVDEDTLDLRRPVDDSIHFNLLLSDKNKLKVLKSFVYADFKCFPNRGAYFFF